MQDPSELQEKVNTLRELIRAQEASPPPRQAEALWRGVLDCCEAFAGGLRELEDSLDDLAAYVETIDEDLADLERQLYGAEEEDDQEEPAYLDMIHPQPLGEPAPERQS